MDIIDKIEKAKLRGFRTVRYKVVFSGAIYHLTQRAPGNEYLFLEEKDYLYMLSLIKDIASWYKWNVFCFVLMPNHLHLLIKINEPNLSEAAKKLFESYAKYFNAKYQRKGPVFCKPFRVSLCFDDTYLLAASLYIHLNPFKAGLCSDPLDYRWSSIKLYTQTYQPDTFVDYKFILKILDDKCINKAKQIYINLLNNSKDVEYKNLLEEPDFIKKFKVYIGNIVFNLTKGIKKKTWFLDKKLSEFLQNKSFLKELDLNKKKNLIKKLLKQDYKINQIAELLKINRSTLYRILNCNKTSVA